MSDHNIFIAVKRETIQKVKERKLRDERTKTLDFDSVAPPVSSTQRALGSTDRLYLQTLK